MTDTNYSVLIGRLTRDAEVKVSQNGGTVLRIALAVNSTKKVQDNFVEEVSYFDIVAFGRMAENLGKYLVKGKQVCVQGELKQYRWEQDGQNRSKVGLIASSIQLLGGERGENSATNAPTQENVNTPVQRTNPATVNPQRSGAIYQQPAQPEFDDTDIPF